MTNPEVQLDMFSQSEDYQNSRRHLIGQFSNLERGISDDPNQIFGNSNEESLMTDYQDSEQSASQEESRKSESPMRSGPKKKQVQSYVRDNQYEKNICGYITKKITKEFTSEKFKKIVIKLCKAQNARYETAMAFYLAKVPTITGPTHLEALLIPENEEQMPMKKAFLTFFQWFLRERYLRYLLSEGKMDKKEVYIFYKNYTLLYLLQVEEEYFY